MITYGISMYGMLPVLLDNKMVGCIHKVKKDGTTLGWQYKPKGQKEGGDVFTKLSDCKKSLE